MYESAQRAWRFYVDDMIAFAEPVIAYADGLDQAGFVARDCITTPPCATWS